MKFDLQLRGASSCRAAYWFRNEPARPSRNVWWGRNGSTMSSSSRRLDTGRFLGVTQTLYREDGLVISEIAHREARELPLHGHESA
jgi:hypothetical protein